MGAGSSGASGGGNTNPLVEKTLNKEIKRTTNLKKEQYSIIDENGNIVFHKQGKNDRVEMTVGEKREYLDGAVTLHNHPDGGTFSSNDLRDFGYGAKEIVIATPEGTYRLVNTKWGTKEQSSGWYDLQQGHIKISETQSSAGDLVKIKSALEKTKVSRDMKKISEKWVKRRSEGASESELKGYLDKYNKLDQQWKETRKAIARKIEVEPYHKYLKENAKKYGFKYIYPKGV